MHPDKLHHDSWRFDRHPPGPGRIVNQIEDSRVYFADRWDYDAYRPLLYALGAINVRNTMVGGIDIIINGAPVQKARKGHPDAVLVKTAAILPLSTRSSRRSTRSCARSSATGSWCATPATRATRSSTTSSCRWSTTRCTRP